MDAYTISKIYAVEVAPYWNVNYTRQQTFLQTDMVEVAPYWNVNAINTLIKNAKQIVEVAPYWNVNYFFMI